VLVAVENWKWNGKEKVASVEGLREKKSLCGFLYFRDRKVCVVGVGKVMITKEEKHFTWFW
jgi:hypothetical protein